MRRYGCGRYLEGYDMRCNRRGRRRPGDAELHQRHQRNIGESVGSTNLDLHHTDPKGCCDERDHDYQYRYRITSNHGGNPECEHRDTLLDYGYDVLVRDALDGRW